MKFGVPQYVEIEDKIAFQLTAKQLGWFALGGVIIFIIWNVFNTAVFIASLIIVGITATAFALYRPHGVSLFTFLSNGFKYSLRSKQLYWNKGIEPVDVEKKRIIKPKKKDMSFEKKRAQKRKKETYEELEEISEILDTKSDLEK